MRGPWDRQDHEKPFAVQFPKPVGAGFYPEHMDETKWTEYLKNHPEKASRLNHLFTMVERPEEGDLIARNYSKVQIITVVPSISTFTRCSASTWLRLRNLWHQPLASLKTRASESRS